MTEPKKRGRPKGSKNAPKIPAAQMMRTAPILAPVVKAVTIDDGGKVVELPETGRCSCGKAPYNWVSKGNPERVFFCPDSTHGGNGKFWTWGSSILKPLRKPKRRRTTVVDAVV